MGGGQLAVGGCQLAVGGCHGQHREVTTATIILYTHIIVIIIILNMNILAPL